MTPRSVLTAFALTLAVVSVDACRKKPEPEPTPTTTVATSNDANARRVADSIAAARNAQRIADSIAAARNAGAGDAARTRTDLINALSQKVFFDYDQDVLRDDARAILDAKAAVLVANPTITLVITGHTDERGTAEYNLALGQRRAAQVKRYLASRGVGEDRMAARSLGDSQPATEGTDEAAYQLNRRAEFEALNIPATISKPRS